MYFRVRGIAPPGHDLDEAPADSDERLFKAGEALALADQRCTRCFGLGQGARTVCKCVYRAIFDVCLRRFKHASESIPRPSRSHHHEADPIRRNSGSKVSASAGPPRLRRFGYPNAEFSADFLLIAKRALGEDTVGYRLFVAHFVERGTWRECGARLGMDRGSFFHEVYRVKERLGRAFRGCEPHALYPLDEYFCGSVRPTRTPASAALSVAA